MPNSRPKKAPKAKAAASRSHQEMVGDAGVTTASRKAGPMPNSSPRPRQAGSIAPSTRGGAENSRRVGREEPPGRSSPAMIPAISRKTQARKVARRLTKATVSAGLRIETSVIDCPTT